MAPSLPLSPPPAALLRYWRVPGGAGPAWVEMFAPLQFAPYPLRDTDGRPLGEENAPEWARDGVPFDERPCPYDDRRRGKPMNATALRQVRQDWAWCLGTVAHARAAYAIRHGLGDAPLDVYHLFGFAAAVGAWPLFLVRAGRCPHDAVPVPVASLFKVIQGVFMTAWARVLASDGRARAVPLSVGGVDVLAREIVAGPLLHSRSSSRVCGGSTAMITDLLARCIDVAPAPAAPTGPAALDGDALTYGCVYAALSLDKWLFGAPPGAPDRRDAVDELRRALAPSLADLRPGPERLTAAQAALAAACGLPPPDAPFDPGWLAGR